MNQTMSQSGTMVSIRNVWKKFGSLEVLKNVSVDVPKSQVFGFIGPSGAGKSTIVRTVNALEGIDGGEIWVNGVSGQRGSGSHLLRRDLSAAIIWSAIALLLCPTIVIAASPG